MSFIFFQHLNDFFGKDEYAVGQVFKVVISKSTANGILASLPLPESESVSPKKTRTNEPVKKQTPEKEKKQTPEKGKKPTLEIEKKKTPEKMLEEPKKYKPGDIIEKAV